MVKDIHRIINNHKIHHKHQFGHYRWSTKQFLFFNELICRLYSLADPNNDVIRDTISDGEGCLKARDHAALSSCDVAKYLLKQYAQYILDK